MNNFFWSAALLLLVLLSCNKEENNPGLTGVYYNRIDLTYPKATMNINKIEQYWDEDIDYKAGSGGVWKGYLEAPFTGEVGLKLSTNKKAILVISDLELVAEGNDVFEKIQMKKGKKYPIELTFLNLKNGVRTGGFDLTWSWGDNDFVTIDEKYISHSKSDVDNLAWITELEKNTFNPKDYLKATNAEHSIVYYEKGGFGAWPANNGIWIWGDEILTSFTKASYKPKPHQHSFDQNKPSKRVFARSLDGGKTWKLEENTLVYEKETKPLSELNEPINFTHPEFALTTNGDKFTYSYDKGKTWEDNFVYPHYKIVDAVNHSARTDYLVLNKNTIRIFMASEHIGEKGWAQDRAYMLETTNGGKDLEFVSWIAETDTTRSVMPASVKITDTHMLSALRRRYNAPKNINHGVRVNWIDLYETKDGGRSWNYLTKIADTDKGQRNGNPPAMVKLSDGTLCIAYAYRAKPYSIRARTSTDNGKTWSKEIIVRDDAIKWDMGYLRLVVRPDDKVTMVYYYTTKERPEQHIEATVWNPKDVAAYH